MSQIMWLKIALAALGIAVWAIGYQADDVRIRWVGIAVLAAAVLLRFTKARPKE